MLTSTLKDVPSKVGRYLERQRRRWIFDRALAKFKLCHDDGDVPPDLVKQLVYGWNNPWSAQEEYIQAFLTAAGNAPGPILECGSGLSTILLGVVAQRNGNQVWCLEHNPAWLAKLRRTLARYAIDSVNVCWADIVGYEGYSWYDRPAAGLPRDFALAVCDGPPGTTPGGRYGFLPVMRDYCRPGCQILLDDAGRPSERDVLERWARELGASFTIEGETKPFGRLVMP
jgi:hypothetical protein